MHVSFVIACVLLMTLSLAMITEKSKKFFLASTFCDKIFTLHDKLFLVMITEKSRKLFWHIHFVTVLVHSMTKFGHYMTL